QLLVLLELISARLTDEDPLLEIAARRFQLDTGKHITRARVEQTRLSAAASPEQQLWFLGAKVVQVVAIAKTGRIKLGNHHVLRIQRQRADQSGAAGQLQATLGRRADSQPASVVCKCFREILVRGIGQVSL